MAKITFPFVTRGKAPLFRLPEPSGLIAIVPELGGGVTEPEVD